MATCLTSAVPMPPVLISALVYGITSIMVGTLTIELNFYAHIVSTCYKFGRFDNNSNLIIIHCGYILKYSSIYFSLFLG